MLALGCAARGGRAEGEYHGCDEAPTDRGRRPCSRSLPVAAVLGGCGCSQTKTVSVAGAPANTRPQHGDEPPPGRHDHDHRDDHRATTPAPTGTAGGTAAPGRHAHGARARIPQQESHAEGVSEAAAVLKARGYTPAKPPSTTPTRRCGCSSARRPAPAMAMTSRRSSSSAAATSAPTPRNRAPASGCSPRATPKSRSAIRCIAPATRSRAQAGAGDRPLPAQQRQTRRAGPDSARQLPRRRRPPLGRSSAQPPRLEHSSAGRFAPIACAWTLKHGPPRRPRTPMARDLLLDDEVVLRAGSYSQAARMQSPSVLGGRASADEVAYLENVDNWVSLERS